MNVDFGERPLARWGASWLKLLELSNFGGVKLALSITLSRRPSFVMRLVWPGGFSRGQQKLWSKRVALHTRIVSIDHLEFL